MIRLCSMHPELLKARMAQSAFTVPAMVERTRLLTKSLVVLKLLKHEKHKAHDARTSGFHDANVICWIWNVYQPGRMSRKVVYICLILFNYVYIYNEGPQPRSQKCLFLRPQKQAPCRARLPELGLCSQDSMH